MIQIQKFVQELAARGDELLDHHTSDLRHLRLPAAGSFMQRAAVEAIGSNAYSGAISLTFSEDAPADAPHGLAAIASLTDPHRFPSQAPTA